MPIVYVVYNKETDSLQYMHEEQMEQFAPELQSGLLEIVDVINTEE